MHDFRGIQNPWRCHWSDEIQKKDVFFRKIVLPGFWDPDSHPSTLIDLVSVALDSRDSVETIGKIWEGCRTHRVVTGPMNFKKSGHFFFRKIMLPDFWGPWLPSKHFN